MNTESPNQACNELIKFLVPLAEGAVVPDFVNEIHEVVKSVRDTGKAGDISLKIKIAPCNGSERQVVVNAEINSKPPKSARPMSLYFTDEDGSLHRQDPLQMGLKFDEEKPEDVKVVVGEKKTDRNVRHYAAVPDNMTLKPLPFLDAEAPEHALDFIDAVSFTKYVKDYANAAESRLFAELTGLKLKCVIDYAKKCNNPSEAIDGECKHRANFVLEETEDFKAFREIDGKTLEQPEFIAFLMERSHCFSSPDQATILEIATKLEVKSNVNFSGKERSNDGGINLTYREDVDARVGTAGKIKVPDFVELELQAFEGGEKMKLRARFYFKLSGGAVLFQVKILNLRETILKNFREVCDKIAEDTGLPIHYTK